MVLLIYSSWIWLVARATADAAQSGTLDPRSTDPSFVERYIFGTTNLDFMDKARYQGEEQMFKESDLSD